MRAVKTAGCKTALAGFGRDRVSVGLLKSLPIDYVKIDGSMILPMLRDSVAISKVITINRIAKEHGMITVAEMVEDLETETKLREIGVDYVQGFGISRPKPLSMLIPARF
jgi:Amt family ammonium transporter